MKIWIIEMQLEDKRKWMPTIGIALSRYDAKERMKGWQNRNPDDKFRLAKYVRSPSTATRTK